VLFFSLEVRLMKVGFRGRLINRNHGQTLVEFAFVLPLLALILFGIIQYGFIFAAYTTLRNASAVAARYATLTNPNPTETQVKALATQAVTPMLDPKNVTAVNVNLNATVGGQPNAKSVEIKYDLKLIIPFVVPGKTSGSSLTLKATTIMR
jgi:Flp pilus assembly protein TadG